MHNPWIVILFIRQNVKHMYNECYEQVYIDISSDIVKLSNISFGHSSLHLSGARAFLAASERVYDWLARDT